MIHTDSTASRINLRPAIQSDLVAINHNNERAVKKPGTWRSSLLHGLYIDPEQHRHGTGARLLSAAVIAACEQGYDGLLAKAQADAEGFFRSQGLQQLAVADETRDYPNRFWLDLTVQQGDKGLAKTGP